MAQEENMCVIIKGWKVIFWTSSTENVLSLDFYLMHIFMATIFILVLRI